MRLDRYLSNLQYGSRKEVRRIIKAARVTVAGALQRDPGFDVPKGAAVALDGVVLDQDFAVYYLLNKPAGVVTANRDDHDRTVMDLIAPGDVRPGLYPVGRLDKDTTGLLLLTNDGTLGHNLLAPGRHVPKTYRATLAQPFTLVQRGPLEAGIAFKDFTSQPATVAVVPGTDARQVELTIGEGKYHQVKRMFLAVGNEVVALHRVAMGPLTLPADLPAGQYRSLEPAELAALKALLPKR
ncbi:pseudouridine synthase [Lacticaseibacillus kribbianus]|uniref:pseudouridine synthase n=1 Tax=Lacticaseibacillus kribbianus TaxID=2926292 RepID=UPI001CD6152F|nr:16S rRNA pseudouridine(516) synthase [Lacticaseibacillus kribbianus]